MSLTVTIADIAKKLNTTSATVSRALNDHPGISIKTKKRVLQAAEKLHYRRNTVASALRKGQTGIIGVIIPSAEINFFGSVVHGIENMANQNGYNVLIYQSNESWEHEQKGIETFLNARVDGIIVSMAKEKNDHTHFVNARQTKMPIVFFDRTNDELETDSVSIDDHKGGYMATEHLIEQGYKRIAHISGPQHLKIFKARLEGYKAALKKNGIPFDARLVYTGDVSIEAGRHAVQYFLELPVPPDAVFAVEDFTALGAIKELKHNNISIPKDFGIIGFANESFGEHISPSLSTIDQQTVTMGKEAFLLMLELIEEKSNKRGPVQKRILDPIPVFRNSSLRNNVS
ncbi:MAG: LacI family transcriptional regulator [Ferruginibacter sp.]|nr:LacI family DNA-binding transcriptional regulator [Ferruginibacter sp.]MBU9935980.1 LacI family transcriptional regulator [Ferruginibacter sp.]